MDSDANQEDNPGGTKGVVIQLYGTRAAADLAVAQLEANGIAAWIVADDGGGFLPNLAFGQGVRVFVSESDVEAAQELLRPPPESPS